MCQTKKNIREIESEFLCKELEVLKVYGYTFRDSNSFIFTFASRFINGQLLKEFAPFEQIKWINWIGLDGFKRKLNSFL